MTLRRSGLRAPTLAGLVAATALSLIAPLAPAAQAAALAKPTGLAAANKNTSTPILSWTKVKNATSYQVQVDNDASFGSPEFNSTTVNYRAVPLTNLRPGENHWRVRATAGSQTSDWANGTISTAAVGVPVPTAPGNGAVLEQPTSPPLLRWTGVQGATSYSVEVDGDDDFVGAKTYSTKTTSLVVPDPLTAGDWYWRVTAIKAAGINSQASPAYRFDIAALAPPTLVYPPNSVNFVVEDVVLDWAPVPGAKSYDLQVALDSTFNNIALDVKNTVGSRYSPPVTLNSDQFWWRVRAVDLAGQPTPWATSTFSFKRQWPDQPQAVFPLGSTSSPTLQTTDTPYFQWTPVQHASHYELYVGDDVNFSPNTFTMCKVVETTYTPRMLSGGCNFASSGVTYWRVRPMDSPYEGVGLPGVFSETQAFTWEGPPAIGTFTSFQPVTGLKISTDGSGLDGAGTSCADELCDNVTSTPVLSWDPQPGITRYMIYYAQDENFTTTEVPSIPVTGNTRFALAIGNSVATLPENEVGSAYYWYVRPCVSPSSCGPSPVSSATPPAAAKSFRKVSPAVNGLTATDPSLSEISFSWNDYRTTNQSALWNGLQANQSAKQYRIQVDTDTAFTAPFVDQQIVDQATYTAYNQLYPEGTLYWRVQAIDYDDNGLTWSTPQTLIKSSPAVNLTSPANGSAVPGTVPFTWDPQPFAGSYQIEVYRNNDAAFSPANRVFAATVKTAAYAWNQPLPADNAPYTWRVRRVDSSGNNGPWSATGRFTSLGAVPQLLTPASGIWQPTAGPLFEWTEVAGAATYQLEVRVAGGTSNYVGVTTVATAHAPAKAIETGSYTWRVHAFDASGKSLGTSQSRTFKVDATPPRVKKIKPTSRKLKPNSLVIVIFTEPVKGVTKKTLFMTPEGKKKPLKAKVTLNKKKTKATIDVKKRFKPGTYLIHALPKIKDLRGNALVGGTAGAGNSISR